jgi:hypothetical protein
VLADGINAVSFAGEEVLYFTKQLMSTIEESARQALPPNKTESQTEYYGTEYVELRVRIKARIKVRVRVRIKARIKVRTVLKISVRKNVRKVLIQSGYLLVF